MEIIPRYASNLPLIGMLIRRELGRYRALNGRDLNFSDAYWTPPLSPRAVYDSEVSQIERVLDMRAIVSITDHDEIEAGRQLQIIYPDFKVPISLEWTVPFGQGFFHVGIHNLPRDRFASISADLAEYTRKPTPLALPELFAALSECPEILVVLNHPLWDIEGIGAESHKLALTAFLSHYARWIHALETNGYRSWRENQDVIALADSRDLPIVAGGDRHASDPSTLLNLTNARSFAEFAQEVRFYGMSDVVVLPEYRESLITRMLATMSDVLRHYPEYSVGQQNWSDRMFVKQADGTIKPISSLWQQGGPAWIRAVIWSLRRLGSARLRPALKIALSTGRKATL